MRIIQAKRAATITLAAAAILAGLLPRTQARTVPAKKSVARKSSRMPAGIKVEATPALWKIQGAHNLLYLLADTPQMKDGVHWQNQTIRNAFSDSHTICFEGAQINDSNRAAFSTLLNKLGTDEIHPLSTKISQEDIYRLNDAATRVGLRGEDVFEKMNPWLAYVTMSILPALHGGYRLEAGIDQTLYRQAIIAGKTVQCFMTVAQSVHVVSDNSEADQVAILHYALLNNADSLEKTDRVVGYWTHGQVDRVAALENAEVREVPNLWDRWIVKPNHRFADWVATLLQNPTPGQGNIFVTLDSNHLAGPDNVITLLAKRGFTVTRVE